MKTNLSSQITLTRIPLRYYRPENAFEHSVLTRLEKIPTNIYESAEEGSFAIAKEIATQIRKKQDIGKPFVIALPGGRSPLSVYKELIRMHKEEKLSFRNVIAFVEYEFYPLANPSAGNLARLKEELFDQVDIDPANIYCPDGSMPKDAILDFCRQYEETIQSVGPAAVGLGIALQMADGSTRVLRMSTALERHLRREFTPFTLCSPADVKGEDVLRILLYQDRQQLPIQALLEKALGDNAAMLRSERTGMDVIVLTPGAVSAEAMLGAVCLPVNCTADQLTVAAGCSQMLELVRQAKQSVVPADAPVELRLAASQTTLTDHDTGAAAEFFYGLVRSAEAAS